MKQVWRQDAAALGGLALLCVLFFHSLIGCKQAWYSLDFYPYVLPYFHWLHQKYSAGLVPAWTQLNFFGYPFLDESLSGFFYLPQRLALTYFDALPALALLTGFHVFLAGAGAYAFARYNGLAAGTAF